MKKTQKFVEIRNGKDYAKDIREIIENPAKAEKDFPEKVLYVNNEKQKTCLGFYLEEVFKSKQPIRNKGLSYQFFDNDAFPAVPKEKVRITFEALIIFAELLHKKCPKEHNRDDYYWGWNDSAIEFQKELDKSKKQLLGEK